MGILGVNGIYDIENCYCWGLEDLYLILRMYLLCDFQQANSTISLKMTFTTVTVNKILWFGFYDNNIMSVDKIV